LKKIKPARERFHKLILVVWKSLLVTVLGSSSGWPEGTDTNPWAAVRAFLGFARRALAIRISPALGDLTMTNSGWLDMAMAYLLFLSSHSLPPKPAVRRHLVGWLGEGGYIVAHTALSVLTLALLIVTAGRAPHVELW
jgi:hypothetical protein